MPLAIYPLTLNRMRLIKNCLKLISDKHVFLDETISNRLTMARP